MSATDCPLRVLAAVDCASLGAGQAAQAMVSPCKVVKTVGGESRRVAAAQKKADIYSDEPDLKQAMDSFHREK